MMVLCLSRPPSRRVEWRGYLGALGAFFVRGLDGGTGDHELKAAWLGTWGQHTGRSAAR